MLFQLAGEFTGKVRFAKLNVDDAPDVGSQCDVYWHADADRFPRRQSG